MEFTLEQFQVATGANEENAALYYPHAVEACARFRIDQSPASLAAFFGTIAIECTRLTQMEEDLYYRDAARLAKLFRRVFDTDKDGVIEPEEIDRARPYCRMPKELSKKLYNGYHGRGAGQLTWEYNYRKIGDYLGLDYVSNPDVVKLPENAILSFAAFWDINEINDVADDIGEVTLRVNGPKRLHLAERIVACNSALGVFA